MSVFSALYWSCSVLVLTCVRVLYFVFGIVLLAACVICEIRVCVAFLFLLLLGDFHPLLLLYMRLKGL